MLSVAEILDNNIRLPQSTKLIEEIIPHKKIIIIIEAIIIKRELRTEKYTNKS